MYFIGPVRDAQSADSGKHFSQRNIAGNSGASVHLNCLIDNLQSNVRHSDFDLGDFAACALGADFIEHPRGLKGKKTGLLQHNARVGNDIGIAAEFGQGLAESHAMKRAAAQKFKSAFGRSQRAHAVVNAAGAEPALRDLETAARSGDDVVERHPYVGKANLAVTKRRVIGAKYWQHALDLHARSIERHQNHGMTSVLGGGAIRYAHEDEQPAMGMADSGTPPFPAVEYDVVPLDEGRSLHVGGIRGGAIGLRHTEDRKST